MLAFLAANWVLLLVIVLALAWVITRLTPSEKDDKVVKFIINAVIKILTIVPDQKKGGGKFDILEQLIADKPEKK